MHTILIACLLKHHNIINKNRAANQTLIFSSNNMTHLTQIINKNNEVFITCALI